MDQVHGLTSQENRSPVTLERIEYRIAHHMQGAYSEMLAVGRCLNEAKEAGLVPHGHWEEWLRQHTGFSERQAQRLMQAARNVAPGSTMEQLPVSKIQMILSLPESEREEVAQTAVADDLTVAQLKKEIERRKKAEDKLQEVEGNLRSHTAVDAQKRKQLQEEITQLREQLAQRIAGMGISDEAQEEIDRLQAELDEAEAYAEKQAELRQATQRKLLEAKSQAARGDVLRGSTEGGLSAQDVAAAVRAFIGTAGMLPHMGSTLISVAEAERQQFRQSIEAIAAWVEGSRKALEHVGVAYEVD